MPNVYGQNTKITNAKGRSEYISGASGKQEEVVLHVNNMTASWEFYSLYEDLFRQQKNQKQNEAREVMIALPNELASAEKGKTSAAQKEKLKSICDEIGNRLFENHDYEYAVHWNHDRTNLHVHFLYSERLILEKAEKKTYKKDIWRDKDTHKLAKAHAQNAILEHRKGEVMKDKNGNIQYKDFPISAKDPKFKSHEFMQQRNEIVQSVLKEYGYDLSIQDGDTPYLSQKKRYKGASEDYLKAVGDYNAAVRDYNHAVQQHLTIQPDQYDTYCAVRKDIESEIRDDNRKEKKISQKAIAAIRDMSDYVVSIVQKGLHTMGEYWEKNKEKIVALFAEKDQLQAQSEFNRHVLKQQDSYISSLKDQLEQEQQEESLLGDSPWQWHSSHSSNDEGMGGRSI